MNEDDHVVIAQLAGFVGPHYVEFATTLRSSILFEIHHFSTNLRRSQTLFDVAKKLFTMQN